MKRQRCDNGYIMGPLMLLILLQHPRCSRRWFQVCSSFLSLPPFNPGCDTVQFVFLHVFSQNMLKTQQLFVVTFYDDQAFVSSVNQPGSSTGTILFIVQLQRITQPLLRVML